MKYNMKDDIEEILLSEKDLQKAVKKLGKQISADYEGKNLSHRRYRLYRFTYRSRTAASRL